MAGSGGAEVGLKYGGEVLAGEKDNGKGRISKGKEEEEQDEDESQLDPEILALIEKEVGGGGGGRGRLEFWKGRRERGQRGETRESDALTWICSSSGRLEFCARHPKLWSAYRVQRGIS